MLYKRGDVYWVKFKLHGETVRKSTGESNRAKAARKGRELQVRAEKAGRVARRVEGRLSELGAADLDAARNSGKSERYIQSLEWMWGVILSPNGFGSEASIDDVTYERLLAFEGEARRTGFVTFWSDGRPRRKQPRPLKGQSIRRIFACLKRACRIARRRGWLMVEPEFPKVASDPPDVRQAGKYWPPETIRAVLSRLPREVADELTFAALTGLRRAELHRVQPGWIVRQGPLTLLRVPAEASKTRRSRDVVLVPEAVAILLRRGESWGADHHKAVGTASRDAGLPYPITLRDLRHFYATHSAALDPVAAQVQLGHSDLAMTSRYAHGTLERAAIVGHAVASALAGGTAEGAQQKRKRRKSA